MSLTQRLRRLETAAASRVDRTPIYCFKWCWETTQEALARAEREGRIASEADCARAVVVSWGCCIDDRAHRNHPAKPPLGWMDVWPHHDAEEATA